MTIEIAPLPGSTTPRVADLANTIAAGQRRTKQMAVDFEAQRRSNAQALLGHAQKQVLDTFRNAKKLMLLGGDMHFMIDMVDSALRLAQPAIKTLRNSYAANEGPSALLGLTKQVRDLANVAEEVALVARMAARYPGDVKRVDKSWSYLSTTLQQTRGLAGMIYVV
jgi:hypothetical protein